MNQSHKPPSIVVGIDGSKPAVQAALWAVDEAASRDIPLRLLYAIEPDDPGYAAHGAAARKLAAAENAVRYAFTAVEAADRPVKVEVEITQERPVTSLIRASAAAALVCVGAIGVHHFQPERVGSTAAALALSAQCPVAIVRPHRVPIGRDAAWIVVEADGSSDIGVLLGAVMAEARLRDSPVRVVTCRQSGVGDTGDDVRASLDRWLARWQPRYPDVRVQSAAVHGELLDYLAGLGRSVHMVVLSASDQEHVEQLVGAPGNAVLQEAGCTLLVVGQQYL